MKGQGLPPDLARGAGPRTRPVEHGWEALRADPLPWLLDGPPNLQGRVLVDLMGRSESSPAVRRARAAASSSEPTEALLRILGDGIEEAESSSLWARYGGLAWTLVAAVQLGADPTDPRLDATARLVLSRTDDDGAFSRTRSGGGLPCSTARLAQALIALGWGGLLRLQEALAWLAEGDSVRDGGGWTCPEPRHAGADGGCLVTACAVLAMGGPVAVRSDLVGRAASSVAAGLRSPRKSLFRFGHPNLMRTDAVEAFAAMVAADHPLEPGFRPALEAVQAAQDKRARWRRSANLSAGLDHSQHRGGRASRWITLRAVRTLMRYAVPAGLERLFPAKPGPPDA